MIRQDIDVEGYWKIIVVYNAYLGHKDTGFTHTDFSKKEKYSRYSFYVKSRTISKYYSA